MKRRQLLKAAAAGAAVIPFAFGGKRAMAHGRNSLLDALLANGGPNDDRVLVVINLAGGNDGLNTVIPFEDPQYDLKRATIGFISSQDKAMLKNYELAPGLAMNPVMGAASGPSFYNMYKDGKVAVVQNVGYAEPNRSHFRSTDIWNSASDSTVLLTTGWLGRMFEADPRYANYPLDIAPGDDPIAIDIGPALNPIFQGSRSGMGLALNDPSKYSSAASYASDPAPDTNFGHELSFIRSILIQSDTYAGRFASLFPNGIPPKNNVLYPAGNPLAIQLKKVAWCIAAGMKTKVYFVSQGSYDTHVQQNSKDAGTGQGRLLNDLAQAISLFQSDLEGFGVADRVTGMTYSEFGRRVDENASNGTDHGTCAPQFIFGKGVQGGVYSDAPNLSNLDANGDLIWKVDFRQLYSSVLGDWFGLSDAMRKAILLDAGSGDRFGLELPLMSSGTKQSLFRQPSAVTPQAAASFELLPNYPNPAATSTTIAFRLAERQQVDLSIFDSRGAKIQTLSTGDLARGEHTFNADVRTLANGTYFYRLEAGSAVKTRAFTVAK